jgi:hypothetical protein
MSILPQGASIGDMNIQEATIQTSKTYKIDYDKGRIVGFNDEIEALKQSIYLILCTERYEYLIYSWNYGSELKGVIAKDRDIAESEFKRRIKDALNQDDRISGADNFRFSYDKDGVLVEFTVFSVFGEFSNQVVL